MSRPDGLAYSTNKAFFEDFAPDEPVATPPPDKQKLRVMTDSKQRAGKTVTLVNQFAGREADLEGLCKVLKNKCGTGGSAKDGQIIIQGDCKEKVVGILKDLGYKNTK